MVAAVLLVSTYCVSSHNAVTQLEVLKMITLHAPVLFTKASSRLRDMVHKLAFISQSIFEHPLLQRHTTNVSTHLYVTSENGDRPYGECMGMLDCCFRCPEQHYLEPALYNNAHQIRGTPESFINNQ